MHNKKHYIHFASNTYNNTEISRPKFICCNSAEYPNFLFKFFFSVKTFSFCFPGSISKNVTRKSLNYYTERR